MRLDTGVSGSVARYSKRLGCFGRMTVCALVFACALAFAPSNISAQSQDKWRGWWELGGYYGSDDASRGEVAVFAPIGQSVNSILFADIRGKLFEDDVQEANLALGHRRMLNSGWNFGFWGGLDVRSSEIDNIFWQAAGGLEMLSERWDVRVNGYAPISDPKSSPSTARVFLSGNNIFMTGGAEVPLYGVDGEIGFKVFGGHREGGGKDGPSYGRRTELRVYGGGFYFDDEDAFQEVAGLKTRLEFRIEDVIAAMPGSRLTLESEYSNDDVRDDKWEVGARLRIPFGGARESRASAYASLSPQARRMTEGLERDTDIVTVESGEENVSDGLTGTDFDRVAFVNNGGSITTTSANAGSESLLIVNGTITGAQVVQGSQTLQGGGSTIAVRGRKSGTVVGFTAPGSRPTVSTAAGDIIDAQVSNMHISGLLLEGQTTSNVGIRIQNNQTNFAITNNIIQNTGSEAILAFNNNSDIVISGNTLTNIDDEGILFFNDNRNVKITNNIINGTTQDGIEFLDRNNNITIAGNNISNTLDEGVSFGSNNTSITITNNAFSNIGLEVIGFFANNTGLTIVNNTASGALNQDFIEFTAAGNVIVSGSGNSVQGAALAGFLCNGAGNFTGPLEITDTVGVLQTFNNSAGCN